MAVDAVADPLPHATRANLLPRFVTSMVPALLKLGKPVMLALVLSADVAETLIVAPVGENGDSKAMVSPRKSGVGLSDARGVR